MFIPAKIKLNHANFLGKITPKISKAEIDLIDDNFYNQLLNKVTDGNGDINGSQLQYLTFPLDEHYDVFISYSHLDEKVALGLYSFLRNRNLRVFLDSTIWHSADRLLREIDKRYSRLDEDPNLIDYTKSLYSSSHVHAMLSMAMLEAINRSELCLFLESNNSTTLKDGIRNYTLSPWIYEELSYISKIKPASPERYHFEHVRYFSDRRKITIVDEQRELNLSYGIDTKNLMTLLPVDFKGEGESLLDNIYMVHNIQIPKKSIYE